MSKRTIGRRLRVLGTIVHLFKFPSLKRRLIVVLVISSTLPMSLMGVYTYHSTYEIEKNKVKGGISASVEQERTNLENVLDNMNFTSRQYAVDGRVVENLQLYLNSDNQYKKAELYDTIMRDITVINFSNPSMGLVFYYLPDMKVKVLFENLQVSPDFHPDKLPLLATYGELNIYGPHDTMYKNGTMKVFSLMRKVDVQSDQSVYVYVESNTNLFFKILNREQFGMEVIHILKNDQQEVVYVEDRDSPSRLSSANVEELKTTGRLVDYELFSEDSPQGWQLMVAIRKQVLNKDINTWVQSVGAIICFSIVLTAILGWLIWRAVYKPMKVLRDEIKRMANNRGFHEVWTNIEEFDDLLHRFRSMRRRVSELIEEVEVNERKKQELEMEKLLVQINPHFLHNTLNSVQWIARIHGQHEIDRIISLLTKVLQYNLGKHSLIVPLRDEIQVLRHYIDLQSMRYQFQFDIRILVEEEILEVPIPRFLLQPLVENALYHGIDHNHGTIVIEVASLSSGFVRITVSDNGSGMAQDEFERLLSGDSKHAGPKVGLGIGLQYVNRLLEQYYGKSAKLKFESDVGKGTTLSFQIPLRIRKELYDHNVDS